jgi:hypothetical protein
MKGLTMPKIQFSELDLAGKRAVFWLAEEAETLTTYITAAASHIGEIFESVAFMKDFPKGNAAHTTMVDRLRLGDTCTESISDCIQRAAPAYRSLGEHVDADLDELLAALQNVALY